LAEYIAEADADFCLTPAYAATCCHVYAASAARSAVCRDPRVTDGEPGSYEADYWLPSDRLAAAAVEQDVFANFRSKQGDARWKEARGAAKSARAAELQSQCDLLRDVFGEYFGPPGEAADWLPFGPTTGGDPRSRTEQWCLLPTPRKLTLHPEWLAWHDGAVLRMAQLIYEEEAFDRMAVLADALEKAGCRDPDILAHCRGPGPHVRGCWLLDLLLGKE
jgi:hypothetical protein